MVVPVFRALGSLAGIDLLEVADSRRALRWVRSKEKPEGVDVGVGASVNSDILLLLLILDCYCIGF